MINNTYNLKGLFDVSDILKNMGAVQDEFNKLGTDHNITESINKSFRSLREEIQNFDVLLGSADSTKGMKQIEQAFTRLQHRSTLLQQNLSDLNIPLKNINFDVLGKELETNLRAASAAFESAEEDVKKYGRQIENLQKMMKDKFNVTTSTLDIGGGVKKAIRDNLQSYEDLVRIKDDYNTKTKEEIAASKSAAGVISKEIDSAKERKLVLEGQKTEQEELVKIASEIVIEREAEVASINRQITALGSLNEQLRKKRELERGKEEKPGQIEKAIEAQKKAQEALDVAKGSGASAKEIKVLERELKKATENTEKLKKGLEEIETRYERILEVEKQREELEKEKAEREKVLRENKEDLSKEEEAQKRIAEEIKKQNKVIDDKVNAHKREQSAGEALADTQTKVNEAIDDAIIDAKNLNQVKEEAAEKTEVLERAQENLNEAYKEATKVGAEKLAEGMEKVNNAMGNMSGPIKQSVSAHEELDVKAKKLDSTFQGLIGRVEMYLGTMAILSQIGRAVRSAVRDFKDFDDAFTEIAVVTNFSVNELWGSFDRYNELAAKLGTTTNNAIKTSALFYQQGLSTSEVWKVTEETMKMATIAGIDFADATRKMTAALRGFSMTVDQAGHVNDVFSTLAAKAAVDTAGLATALSKTASIADNAGMSFENTSAFLAKMQETTQEAAENIGTSMKTIVARFTELKQSPFDLTVEVEGEIVDANRVEAALRLAGVDLRDATGQFRDLDDVFLDLGGRWKSLDRLTQRYIATTAAGSRQQSRFIALMEDHERTLELVGLAHDAAGQSALQFSKTLEGFEAKINQLKVAWEKLYTNFLSSQFFKDAIDGITNIINRLSDMPPLLAVIVSVISISVIKNIISSFLSGIKTVTQGIGDVRQEFSAAKVDWSKPIKLFFSDNLDQVSSRVNAVKAGANVPASVAPVGGMPETSLTQNKVVGGSSMLASLKSSVGGAVASGIMAGLATGLTTGNASTGLKTGLAATALQLFSSKAVTTAIVTGVKAIGTAIIANPLIAVGVVAAAGLAWITKALIDANDKQKQLERAVAKAKREYEDAVKGLEEAQNKKIEKSNELKNLESLKKEYEKYSEKVALTTEEQQKYNDLVSQIKEQYPDLIVGYNEMGDAVIATADAWDRILASQRESLRLAREEESRQEMVVAGTSYNLASREFDAAMGEKGSTIEDLEELKRETEILSEAISELSSEEARISLKDLSGALRLAYSEAVSEQGLQVSYEDADISGIKEEIGIEENELEGIVTKLKEAVASAEGGEIKEALSSLIGEEKVDSIYGKDFVFDSLSFESLISALESSEEFVQSFVSMASGATQGKEEKIEKATKAAGEKEKSLVDFERKVEAYAATLLENKAEELEESIGTNFPFKLKIPKEVDISEIYEEALLSFEREEMDLDSFFSVIEENADAFINETTEGLSDWMEGNSDTYKIFISEYNEMIKGWEFLTPEELNRWLVDFPVPGVLKGSVIAGYEGLFTPALDLLEALELGAESVEDLISMMGLTDIPKIYHDLTKDEARGFTGYILGNKNIGEEEKKILLSGDYSSMDGLESTIARLVTEQNLDLDRAKDLVRFTVRAMGKESDFAGEGGTLSREDLFSAKTLGQRLKEIKAGEITPLDKALNELSKGFIENLDFLDDLLKDYPELITVFDQIENKTISVAEAFDILSDKSRVETFKETVTEADKYLKELLKLQEMGAQSSGDYKTALSNLALSIGIDPAYLDALYAAAMESQEGMDAFNDFLSQLFIGLQGGEGGLAVLQAFMGKYLSGVLTEPAIQAFGYPGHFISSEDYEERKDFFDKMGWKKGSVDVEGYTEADGYTYISPISEGDYKVATANQEKYVSSLDKQEGLLRAITAQEKERSKASKKASDAKTGIERQKALESELAAVNGLIQLQGILASNRKKEQKKLASKEEMQKHYESGILTYDEETGSFDADQRKLETATLTKEDGEALETYIQEMMSLEDQAEAANDAVEDLIIARRSLEEELALPGEFLSDSRLMAYSTEMKSAAETIRDVYKTLSSYGELTESQLNNLLKTFPELTSSISQYSRGVKSLAELQKDMNKALSEQGLRKLVGVLETNVKALKDAKEGTKEYAEAIENLGNAMGFSSEDTIKNIDLFKKAIDGSYEAMVELQAMALAPIVQEFLIDGSANVDFSSLLNGIAVTEEGAEILKAKLAELGLTVDYETVVSTVEFPVVQPGIGGVSLATAMEKQIVVSKVPKIRPASEGTFRSSFSAPKGGGGGGGKGGGGGGKWDNGYDKQYNLLQKINQQLRKRELLERAIAEAASPMDITKNLQEQQKLVEQTKTDYETLLKNRKAEMAQALKDNRKLASYATYDAATGQIMINWSKINKVKKAKDGEKIDTYISLLEKIQGQIKEAEDGLNDQTDVLKDLETIFREDYLSLEQRTYDAMVKREQETLDSLSKINDSINDANTRLINSIRKEIDRMREERENERTEKELADKMKRLALLQRDTSGVFELEIRQLKDEIEKEQESYSDTLVDQTLQRMQDEFDEAADDRSRNIQLLQNQKDWRAENGFYWAQTIALLGGSEKSLREFLQTYDESYKAMSPEAQKQYLENLAQQYNLAIGWYVKQYGKMPSFDTGGLATYTGLANIHGTPTRPELVLNATDTKNFLVLKDVLNDFLKGYGGSTTNNEGSTVYIDISVNVDEIANSYSVDEMLAQIKKEIATEASYRNVNIITRNQG